MRRMYSSRSESIHPSNLQMTLIRPYESGIVGPSHVRWRSALRLAVSISRGCLEYFTQKCREFTICNLPRKRPRGVCVSVPVQVSPMRLSLTSDQYAQMLKAPARFCAELKG